MYPTKTRKRMAIFLAVVAVVFFGLFATEVVPMWGIGIAVGCVFLSGFVGICLTPRARPMGLFEGRAMA